MIHRLSLLVVLALVALSACGSSQSTKPDFGDDQPPATVDSPELQELKAQAGIDDCPAPRKDGSGSDLPSTVLPCLGGGNDLALTQLPPRPAVINLWASYCKPCRQELPILQEASQHYDDVTFIGVDMADPKPESALKLVDESGVTYPQLADASAALRVPLKVRGLPQTVFVDADGRIVFTHQGAFTSIDEFREAVDTNLGVDNE